MPEVDIHIGGRVFQVACQEGEEHFLQSAAGLLDTEAQSLAEALGRVPETRMLLMAGLMLADKTAGLEEQLRAAQLELSQMATARAPAIAAPKEVEIRVEVPTIPDDIVAEFAKIADRAEGLAEQVADAAAE
ncbi:MAG: cell division protein ZapA [Alphaproteobacteria bacterium]|nr:cell division protein ZapA [Alphaproteobacteria bacterium]